MPSTALGTRCGIIEYKYKLVTIQINLVTPSILTNKLGNSLYTIVAHTFNSASLSSSQLGMRNEEEDTYREV